MKLKRAILFLRVDDVHNVELEYIYFMEMNLYEKFPEKLGYIVILDTDTGIKSNMSSRFMMIFTVLIIRLIEERIIVMKTFNGTVGSFMERVILILISCSYYSKILNTRQDLG